MTNEFKTDCLAIVKLALETPEETAHIMCEWVAHCQFFAVRVYLGGWRSGDDPSLKAECHDLTAKTYTPFYHIEPAKVFQKIQALLA